MIPELLDENNQLERLIISGDNHIIMCGHILIQMSNRIEEVLDIGVIYYEKVYSINKYRFISLLKEDGFKEIQTILRLDISTHNFVKFKFDKQPVCSNNSHSHAIYFDHQLNQDSILSLETSIIKL